ncbi:copper resistance protein B [Aquabacterium sp. J223]|uniref:copper resistance protein B n=1 Tax=Aquabacterium sp. J223 TaxID=2898431 RepID=UPI0021AD81F7|nr:copper resistance protein B [Aquabacterium sp. J223]UUX96677.1 copper resistance protein B [Aquabacterium sp. J223]
MNPHSAQGRGLVPAIAAAALLTAASAIAQQGPAGMGGMGGMGGGMGRGMPMPSRDTPAVTPGRPSSPAASRADGEVPMATNTRGPMSSPVSDDMSFGQVLIDEFEYGRARGGANALSWNAQAWYGRDYNRVWLKARGERQDGRTQDASADLLWSKPVATFWDLQAGIRRDFGQGSQRTWGAFGVQGLAPYFFNIEATAYFARSRAAARLRAQYDFVLTQRMFLTPEIEADLYSRSEPAAGIGSGLSSVNTGLRLRYEIRREFAPYIGLSRSWLAGNTAELARAAGERTSELRWVAGVRIWF